MVTTLNIDRLKALKAKGGLHVGDYDPLRYMATLEAVGFEKVHIEYFEDSTDSKFQTYQAIIAEIGEKKLSRKNEISEEEENDGEESDGIVANCNLRTEKRSEVK